MTESRAQLAIFAAVQAQAASNNNNQSTVGELRCQAHCFRVFVRRIRHVAINMMDPLPGQMAAQPNMYEVRNSYELRTSYMLGGAAICPGKGHIMARCLILFTKAPKHWA